jgi:hypothetical protein
MMYDGNATATFSLLRSVRRPAPLRVVAEWKLVAAVAVRTSARKRLFSAIAD